MGALSDGVRVVQTRMKLAGITAMVEVLEAFKAHYNHARPHQSLNGGTPGMVWNGQMGKRLAKVRVRPSYRRRQPCQPRSSGHVLLLFTTNFIAACA